MGQRKKKVKGNVTKQARILRILHTYLSMLVNGKRKWPDKLRHRYEELVNSIVNTTAGTGETEEQRNESSVPEKRAGGAEGIRTPDFLLAKEALGRYLDLLAVKNLSVSYIEGNLRF